MSHTGKRNTSRPVFTAYERQLAKSHWSAGSARLNRESFLAFGSCILCLEIARDPVACHRGDIFCRECALANLVAQKKELKRAAKSQREAVEDRERIKAIEDEEDRERAIRDFELTQAGLNPTNKRKAIKEDEERQPGTAPVGTELVKAGAKRKFALDETELARIAQEDRSKARKAIEDEKSAKPTLPSFWSPSLTPDVQDSRLSATSGKTKTNPICPASTDSNTHPLSMQKLVTLQFDEEQDESTKKSRRICPSCRKVLTNSSTPVMVKQCGHVLCHPCVKQFMLPAKSRATSEAAAAIPITCLVCDATVATGPPKDGDASKALPSGLVMLRSEGTGFSAKGSNTVAKSDVAFQC